MTTSVRRATWTVLGVAIGAKAVGFLREVVVARSYGTSEQVDLFLAAVTVPAILGTVLSFAVPNAFVPLFATEPRSRRTRVLATAIVLGAAILSIGVAAFGPAILDVTATGFDAAARARTELLLRIVAGTVAFAAIEAIGRSRLHVRKSFLRPGMAFAWQNAAIIAAVLWRPEGGARTLTWGYAAGSVLAAAWNLLPARGAPPPEARMAGLPTGSVARWVALVVVADSLGQVYAFLDRRYGSFLPEGTMAALQYGNLLAFLPLAIVATGLGSAILPFLAEAVARDEHDRAAAIFRRAVGAAIEALVPLTLWFVVFRDPIVSIVLERGAFDEASRRLTAPVLASFATGLLPGAFVAVATKLFHARRDVRPVLTAVLAGGLVKWIFSVSVAPAYGAPGLALGTGAGLLASAVVLAIALPSWCRHGALAGWARTAVAAALPTGLGIVAGRVVVRGLHAARPDLFAAGGKLAAVIDVGTGVGLGVVLLVLGARRLGLHEIVTLLGSPRAGKTS